MQCTSFAWAEGWSLKLPTVLVRALRQNGDMIDLHTIQVKGGKSGMSGTEIA